jgi:hypothetical protein
MTVHEHAQRVLSAGVDGEADADDLALAMAHVERCRDCRRVAGDFARVVESVGDLLPAGRAAWLTAGDLPDHDPPGPGATDPGGGGLTRRKVAYALADPRGGAPVAVMTRPGDTAASAPGPRQGRGSRLLARMLATVAATAALGAAALLVVIGAVWVRSELQAGAPPTRRVTTVAAEGTTDVRSSATVAARAWVTAAVQGNRDAAWSLLSPRGKAAFGDRDALAAALPGLAEAYGPLRPADRPAPKARAVLLNGGDDEVRSVVVFAPRTTADRPLALPVTTVGGTSLVEPYEPALAIRTRTSARTLTASVTPGASWVRMMVDESGPVAPALTTASGRAQASVRTRLGAGRHTLVTAAMDGEGRLAVRADAFDVP